MAKKKARGAAQEPRGSVGKRRTPLRGRAASNPGALPVDPEADLSASKRFVADLLIRGEAVKGNKKGKVPHEATHRIKKKSGGGDPQVERVRFKLF